HDVHSGVAGRSAEQAATIRLSIVNAKRDASAAEQPGLEARARVRGRIESNGRRLGDHPTLHLLCRIPAEPTRGRHALLAPPDTDAILQREAGVESLAKESADHRDRGGL